MTKPILGLAAALCLAIAGTHSTFAQTTIIDGEIIEFAGPDDLLLDPAQAVVAVDVFGNADSVVNGVNFRTDGQQNGGGSVTENGVTVTTTAPNQINDWAAAQNYTGADAASASALSGIMRDIRWQGAPNTLAVDISGLNPGTTYNLQLLFNEGANRDRWFDIAVAGNLVVDNFSSEGEGVWTNSNGFAYTGDFTANGAGAINISMAANLGGDDRSLAPGADGNPILQGIVVSVPEPSSSALLGLATLALLARRRRGN